MAAKLKGLKNITAQPENHENKRSSLIIVGGLIEGTGADRYVHMACELACTRTAIPYAVFCMNNVK